METNAAAFGQLEAAVLARMLDLYSAQRHILRSQLSNAQVKSREVTPTGFYLNFEVSGGEKFEEDMELNRVYAHIGGLEFGAGFILFVRDGTIKALEGYSYEEKWPDTITTFSLYTDLQ